MLAQSVPRKGSCFPCGGEASPEALGQTRAVDPLLAIEDQADYDFWRGVGRLEASLATGSRGDVGGACP